MSVKLLAWVHWLITVRPYAVGTIVAFLFVLLKGVPVLDEWFSAFMSGWSGKKLGLSSKLRKEPQLALVNGDRSEKSLENKLGRTRVGGDGINRNRWLIRIGVMNFCVGFVALIVWLFGR
jgi:hypothetical protein